MENIKICEYGCGKAAKFQLKCGKWCCSESFNKCEAVRFKNSKGCKEAYETDKRSVKGFSDTARKKSLLTRQKHSFEYMINNPNQFYASEVLRRSLLFSGREEKCEICGISEWQGKKLSFEIDHIDGDRSNNDLSNLRFLCPNCHSQTDTWRGRNINSGKTKVSDEELLEALKSSKNIRQALIKVGLAPKGANYTKAARLLAENKG